MSRLAEVREEINQWFFSEYFDIWVGLGAGRLSNPERIVNYWGEPFHSASPAGSGWHKTPAEIVTLLNRSHDVLKQEGFTHTDVLDKRITVYNENAARTEAIWSRCRGDGIEVQRVAVSFEIRRTENSWVATSVASTPTEKTKLSDIWLTD